MKPKRGFDPAALSPEKRALIEKLLRKKGVAAGASTAIPRRPAGVDPPLAYLQEGLWFLDQLNPGLLTYNMWVSLHMIGPLDEDAIAAAIEEIVRRHDILRTRYPDSDGVPRQEVDPALRIPLELTLPPAGVEEGAWREEAHERMQVMLVEPYDLATGPLSRARLIRLARQEHVLLFLVHHIAFDGLSKGVFARELTQLYEAFARGDP